MQTCLYDSFVQNKEFTLKLTLWTYYCGCYFLWLLFLNSGHIYMCLKYTCSSGGVHNKCNIYIVPPTLCELLDALFILMCIMHTCLYNACSAVHYTFREYAIPVGEGGYSFDSKWTLQLCSREIINKFTGLRLAFIQTPTLLDYALITCVGFFFFFFFWGGGGVSKQEICRKVT